MTTRGVSLRLAERLRDETRSLHVQAERSAFMARLMRGAMSRTAYVDLLRNLLAIYAELEPALRRHAIHPALAALDLAALARTQSLGRDVADIAALGDSAAGPQAGAIQPSCLRYVERLRTLDASQPELLLAHAYVRYLGDLSGGQMLRRIVARSMTLPDGVGTSFYEFGDAAVVASLAEAFRRSLDVMSVDEDAVVAEAKGAFELHRSLFDELARAHGLAA